MNKTKEDDEEEAIQSSRTTSPRKKRMAITWKAISRSELQGEAVVLTIHSKRFRARGKKTALARDVACEELSYLERNPVENEDGRKPYTRF